LTIRRELTFEDYLPILRRRRWLIIIPAILGISTGFLLSSFLPKRYTSHTLILVEQPAVSESYVKPVVSEALDQRLASMKEQILSRTRLQHLVEQFHPRREDGQTVPMEELVEGLRKTITVTPLSAMAGTRSSQLPGFSVDVTLGDARLAQQICTEITSLFMEQNLRTRQQHAEETAQFLAKQLEEAKARLDDQDAKLATFQRQYIGELPEDDKSNLALLMGMGPQLQVANQALNQARQEKTFTESLLNQQLAALNSSKETKNPQTLGQQLRSLQNQLQSLEGHYTEHHPDVVKLKNEIAELQKKLDYASTQTYTQPSDQNEQRVGPAIDEPPEIQQLRARLHQTNLAISQRMHEQEELQRQIKILQGRVQSSPMIQLEFKSLTRDYQTALEFYNDLLKKRNESQMATELERRQQGEQFRVLDPPSLPERPSYPEPSLFGLGGLGAGLVLGLGMALIFEFWNKSMWTKEDIEFYLGAPTLALIPSIESVAGKRKAIGRDMDIGANHTRLARVVLGAMNKCKQFFSPGVLSTQKGRR
jgi:polysaccharide chain length determinant protein (PEP-CTERM system associated)